MAPVGQALMHAVQLPQWAVVGDTFPVGCRHSDRIVYAEFFAANPDSQDSRYNSELGIYGANCGLDQVHMSWGHDEYLYHLLKDYLPEPAQYMIRYHSFYAWHKEGQYRHLTDARDEANLPWVQKNLSMIIWAMILIPGNVAAPFR